MDRLLDQLERMTNLVNEMLYLESMSLPVTTGLDENIDFSSLIVATQSGTPLLSQSC